MTSTSRGLQFFYMLGFMLLVGSLVGVGWFFNQILPMAVCGDLVRARRCHQIGASLASAIRSVLVDRVCGVCGAGSTLSGDLTRSAGHRS